MTYCFVAVNYGTSSLIEHWIESIHNCYNGEIFVIIVDNYKDNNERQKTIALSEKIHFTLIESENKGYGAGLNQGISYAARHIKGKVIMFCGNMDLIYTKIPRLKSGDIIHIPKVLEGKRDRNPFLTNLQRKFTPMYHIAGRTKSPILYYIVISINKLLGVFPSKIWAVHGSLFCFDLLLIDQDLEVFNNKSFLYGEELEFASYMESRNAIFLKSEITVKHASHVCTQDINNSIKLFLDVWYPSFKNWANRWK